MSLAGDALLKLFQSKLPRISETEKTALESGDVGFEGSIFKGQIDWERLLHSEPVRLSAEEQAFLDGPVQEFCDMIDPWAMSRSQEQDIPPEAWQFLKDNGFLGMVIAKEHGGLGFSAAGHAAVVEKVASHSYAAAVDVMVPNSLGPGELITHYGTDEQKAHYLPRLARGDEIPCFALTEPEAGSDATNIQADGEVFMDENGKPQIRLNFTKRYITLAPVATLVGLAFNLRDPQNLLGQGTAPGITVGMAPAAAEGLSIGRRHSPNGLTFPNGPITGENVIMSPDSIIGGPKQAGKGWHMLVENLGVGRAISLPSVSVGAMKAMVRTTGAYSQIRYQFGLAIGKFEGIQEALAEMAGLTYLTAAAQRFTIQHIDHGQRPSVLSAVMKYQATEHARRVLQLAMDIEGGHGIIGGPGNTLSELYRGMPMSITVEGANILTRNLLVFGSGVIRSHPYVLDEVKAAESRDAGKLLKLLASHGLNIAANVGRAFRLGIDNGLTSGKPVSHPAVRGYAGRINRLASAFNVAANTALLGLGGALKKKENLSAKLGDTMSHIYMAGAALRKFELDGRLKGDLPLVRWACEYSLHRAEEALYDFVSNYPNPLIKAALKADIFPLGRRHKKPSDALSREVATAVTTFGNTRDSLTGGIYRRHAPDDTRRQGRDGNNGAALIDSTLFTMYANQEAMEKAARALKDGFVTRQGSRTLDLRALKDAGCIDAQELQALLIIDALRARVIGVSDFAPEDMAPHYAAPAPEAV